MNYRFQSTRCSTRRCDIICCFQSLVQPLKFNYIEPIYQAYVKKPESIPIHCPSNKCDYCLNEYFEKCLRPDNNSSLQDNKGKLEIGRPNAVITAPNVVATDEQLQIMQDDALSMLEKEMREFRRRYALIQTNDGVFILGGYIVDEQTNKKLSPISDYFYNATNKELIPIPPLPGKGRVSFGLAATDDGKIIVAGGHDFYFKTMKNVSMLDTRASQYRWVDLPDMPDGTIGPGVSVFDDTLFVIGGFDFIEREALFNGDVIFMDLKTETWKTLTNLDPPRARPLITFIDTSNPPLLIVAGGYNIDESGKVIPCNVIEEYNNETKTWTVIGTIPNFKTTDGVATKNNKLYLINTSNGIGHSDIQREFNLKTRQWENSNEPGKSVQHRTKTYPNNVYSN